jgi:hypothetical protein
MNYSLAPGGELLQGRKVVQIAGNKLYAQRGQGLCFFGVSDQGFNVKALLQQVNAKGGADETGSAGNCDQAACCNQADATIRRTSSAAALSCSMLWALMKSSRALARDSLPEEVRGRARLGTSFT